MTLDSTGWPDGASLLALERSSAKLGSGLCPDDLVGTWRLERLWSKGRSQPAHAAAATLRTLAARLALHPAKDGGMQLANTVGLGPLKLCFHGSVAFRGRRPLLVFQFQTMRVSLAGHLLWTLSLPKPDKGREPFFALISSQRTRTDQRWLAARGRGGGVALWVREEDGSA
ncbi:MAG: hypothetical protein ACK587_05010 [Cyanobacteriota bacterium]